MASASNSNERSRQKCRMATTECKLEVKNAICSSIELFQEFDRLDAAFNNPAFDQKVVAEQMDMLTTVMDRWQNNCAFLRIPRGISLTDWVTQRCRPPFNTDRLPLDQISFNMASPSVPQLNILDEPVPLPVVSGTSGDLVDLSEPDEYLNMLLSPSNSSVSSLQLSGIQLSSVAQSSSANNIQPAYENETAKLLDLRELERELDMWGPMDVQVSNGNTSETARLPNLLDLFSNDTFPPVMEADGSSQTIVSSTEESSNEQVSMPIVSAASPPLIETIVVSSHPTPPASVEETWDEPTSRQDSNDESFVTATEGSFNVVSTPVASSHSSQNLSTSNDETPVSSQATVTRLQVESDFSPNSVTEVSPGVQRSPPGVQFVIGSTPTDSSPNVHVEVLPVVQPSPTVPSIVGSSAAVGNGSGVGAVARRPPVMQPSFGRGRRRTSAATTNDIGPTTIQTETGVRRLQMGPVREAPVETQSTSAQSYNPPPPRRFTQNNIEVPPATQHLSSATTAMRSATIVNANRLVPHTNGYSSDEDYSRMANNSPLLVVGVNTSIQEAFRRVDSYSYEGSNERVATGAYGTGRSEPSQPAPQHHYPYDSDSDEDNSKVTAESLNRAPVWRETA